MKWQLSLQALGVGIVLGLAMLGSSCGGDDSAATVTATPRAPSNAVGGVVVATGLVQATGTQLVSPTGPVPTVKRNGPGDYQITIAGVGSGCPYPTFTPVNGAVTLWITSISCEGGSYSSRIIVQGGGETTYTYMFVGQ